jgi:AcrR family transcriptional regulator
MMAIADVTRQARVTVILDAAERLIRKEGATQFSMRALAQEAGVSPATPFNLLGSKEEILRALFERSFVMPEGLDPRARALEQIFQLSGGVTRRYTEDEAYYRTLMIGIGTRAEPLLTAIEGWKIGIKAAINEGDLRTDTQVDLLAETLELAFVGVLGFWIPGAVPSARLGPQCDFAIAATLLGFSTPRGEPQLRKQLKSAARALRTAPAIGI